MAMSVQLILVAALAGLQPTAGTLASALARHGLEAPFDDAARAITSYATMSDAEAFAIAYYWREGERLPGELRVRTLDRTSGVWRSTVIARGDADGGSVTRMIGGGGWLYLSLQQTPSAATLLVLDDRLRVTRRLRGWPLAVARDGRLAYHASLIPHFAPAHPAQVRLYDPGTGEDAGLFPEQPQDPMTLVDRTIEQVAFDGPNRLRIAIVVQQRRLRADDRSVPAGPERRSIVTCTLTPPRACRATDTATGGR